MDSKIKQKKSALHNRECTVSLNYNSSTSSAIIYK